jgi:hypothetical protein
MGRRCVPSFFASRQFDGRGSPPAPRGNSGEQACDPNYRVVLLLGGFGMRRSGVSVRRYWCTVKVVRASAPAAAGSSLTPLASWYSTWSSLPTASSGSKTPGVAASRWRSSRCATSTTSSPARKRPGGSRTGNPCPVARFPYLLAQPPLRLAPVALSHRRPRFRSDFPWGAAGIGYCELPALAARSSATSAASRVPSPSR